MRKLIQACQDDWVILDLEAGSLEAVFQHVVDRLAERELIRPEQRPEVVAALLERERQASTAIGQSVAVPHAYLPVFAEPVVAFVRLAHAMNLGAPDGIPTHFVFVLLGPPEATREHLDTLAAVARVMSDNEFRYDAGCCRNADELLAAVLRFRQRNPDQPAAAPAPRKPPTLTFTGRLCGGLINDLRRRLPYYTRDFRAGVHPKCAAATVFLYFACLAPAITFGGVMAVQTEGQIGAVEMIVACAACGVIYALVAGQPLIILGGTGPMLVFTGILYRLCQDWNLPFLPTYAWVGLWTALLLVLLAAFDASCLMRYFTRFTDEIFAALISLIFIYEAVKALVHIFQDLDAKQHHDTALLSLLLALGTFYIAMTLSGFRRSRYLLHQAREFLADFGPAIAIASMTLVAVWLHEVYLDMLPTPQTFQTTLNRPWQIPLGDAPPWVRLGAVVPAVLVTVLMFLDQNITARLVDSPDHNLQDGEAYHLDLFVVGALLGICSLFGLPWLVAATVRSLNHVRALATSEDVVKPDGETRSHILQVRENRLTGLAIHLLLGLSLLLLPLISQIPMAVLYGVFLYMGVVSMRGNQFFERINLWWTDPSLYPATHYIRRVPIWIVHKFTFLQLICLSVLWAVKVSVLGILFPLFIALLVPVRMLAARFIPGEYLAALDAEEEPEEEELQWA
jgi:mannitol/fructose-specific phosphotransferase system IIA component (Ntr-type)